MAELGDFLKSINTKNRRIDDLEIENDYVPFLINRTMSYFPDTLLFAWEMSKYPQADKVMQYDYYYYGVRKRNRFSRWKKPKPLSETAKMLMEYYGYSKKEAEKAASMIPESEIKRIKRLTYTGGIKK